jgi:hypothetical protein
MVSSQESTEIGASRPFALIIAKPPRVNTSNSMWPANMLAKSRTDSENGRIRNVEMNSIGISSGRMYQGAGGTSEFLKYLTTPCFRMPT